VVLDGIGEASGDLFLDDGLSIDIKRWSIFMRLSLCIVINVLLSYFSYTYVQYTVSKNVLSTTVSGTVSW
jgi:hypothetical protein